MFKGLQITKIVVLFLLVLLVPLSFALEQTGTNYNSEVIVVDGGTNGSSNNYQSLVSIASITGKASSTNYNLDIGGVYALTGYPPSVSSVVLSSTSGQNFTTDNLTVTYNTADQDNDFVYGITDWKLNGNSIAVLNMPFNKRVVDLSLPVEDYSDYNNDGVLSGASGQPTWSADCMVGGCYEFDGGTSYLDLGNSASVGISPPFTFTAWIMPHDYGGDVIYYFFSKGTGASGYSLAVERNYGSWPNNSIAIFDGATTINSSANAIVYDAWNHVALSNDGTTSRLYVNGTEVASGTQTLNPDAGSSLTLGRRSDAFGEYGGWIDEVLFLNRTLSSQQINQIYQDGLAGKSLETIVSQETDFGDVWRTELIPVDEFDRGSGVLSNTILVGTGDLSISLNNTFVNSTTAHLFNVTAGASYSMGYEFIQNHSINYDTFSCIYTSNSTEGTDMNVTYTCTGTPYQTTNISITFCDFQNNCLSTPITGNDYPNQAPTLGTLISPNSTGFYIDRNQSFNWTVGSDIEGDEINYTINITHSTVADPTPIPVANITTLYYYVSEEMHTNDETMDIPYYWSLQVCDLWDCSEWSALENFTITSYLSVSITQNETNFNTVNLGQTLDTDSDASPFIFENDGNVNANATNATATDLWETVTLDTSFYQLKADVQESNSFDNGGSQTTWMNVSGTPNNNIIIGNLNYSDANDEAQVDIRITVPGAEPPGQKNSIINFWYVQS